MVRLEKFIDYPLIAVGIIKFDIVFSSGPYVEESFKISAENLESFESYQSFYF